MAASLPALWVAPAAAQDSANAPLFQYGAFFNLDLDFTVGIAWTMNGKVHCNGTIWMYPQATATFNDTVEATVVVTNKDNPNDQQNLTSYVTPIHYNGGQPLSGVASRYLATINARINPTNPEAILNLPPYAVAAPNDAAYDPTNQVYLFNECDLIISNAINGSNGVFATNITIYYQDKDQAGYNWRQLTNYEVCTFMRTNGPITLPAYWTTNSPNRPTTNYTLVASGFPFVTNVAFYDYRESAVVQAVQIDIGQLGAWLTNSLLEGAAINYVCGGSDGAHGNKGHPIDSIYVYSKVPWTRTQRPAVRLVNGAQLPSPWGLTVATPMPIYTLGNYNIQTNSSGNRSFDTTNTAWTWPAALMGDAITILSSRWSDSYSPSTSLNSRSATNTTVNAACLAGMVSSTMVGTNKHYSGGLENFLRMQENWNPSGGQQPLWYNGSINALFPSAYATNFWIGPGTYYNPPQRNWGFDANYLDPVKLPPLTPMLETETNPPVIIVQPQDQTVAAGQTAAFSVTATGSLPLNYQWSFNGTDLDGATNASLTLVNVQTNQAGTYSVLVENAFDMIRSAYVTLTVNPPPPCIPATYGLTDWWPAEGNAGDTFGDNNGTLQGGAGYVAGEVGQAFSFDGSTGCISIPDSPSLDSFTTNITIELWLKAGQLTANPDWEGIVTKGNSSWRLQATAKAQTVTFSTSGTSPNVDLSGTRNVNDGLWHHVAAVYDGTGMYLYVDGTLDVSRAVTGSMAQDNDPLCIGANAKAYVAGCNCNELGYFFKGSIDEVSIYHRALSASEIQSIYLAAQQGKCPPVAPIITSQPASQMALGGETVNFNVAADGSAPLLYQWQWNGTNIDGATNATLTLSNVTVGQAGDYSVAVTNFAGSAISSNAVLSVYATTAATLGGYSFAAGYGFQFQVAGVPGFNYAVQESTNLIDWVSLITNTSPFYFIDTNAAGPPQQFYRAIYSP